MEDRMYLKKFLQVIKRRIKIIIITFLSIFLLTAAVATFVMKPTYEATGTILVGKFKNEEGFQGEINMLLASTVDLLKSPIVLNDVKNNLNIKKDRDLVEDVSVQNNRNSQIINVVVRDNDPEMAQLLADTISITAVKYMNDSFNVNDVEVLNATELEPERVGSLALNLAIGFVVSIFCGIGLAVLREELDESLKESREVEEILDLPIIGTINLKQKRKNHILVDKPDQESKSAKTSNRGEVRV